MTVGAAHEYIKGLEADSRTDEANYAGQVVRQRLGEVKSLPKPLKFNLSTDQAKVIRGEVDAWLAHGEKAVPPPPPGFRDLTKIPARPERYSLTGLRQTENCLLGHRLARAYDAPGPAAIQGTLFHGIAETLALNACAEGLESYDAKEAVGLAQDIMREDPAPGPLALSVHSAVLDMTANWARKQDFWTDADLFLAEHLFDVPFGKWRLSGRADLIQIRGALCRIDDYKTSQRVPSQDEFDRGLQTPYYSWLALQEFPGIEMFDTGEMFVRYGVRRSRLLEAEDLALEGYLEAACSRLDTAWDTGSFPATPGPHCAYCAAPERCPVPREARPDMGAQTMAEAVECLEWLSAVQAQVTKVKASLSGFVRRTGEAVESGGMEAGYHLKVSERLDRDLALLLLEQHGVAPDDVLKTVESTEFTIRKAATA